MGKTDLNSSSRASQLANILWLTENYFPQRGGMAESCDRIVHGLRSEGIRIDVGNISNRSARLQVLEKLNGADITIPLDESLPHALNRLWNQISGLHALRPYTALVAFGGVAPLTASPIFAAWLKIPSIVCLRGNDFDSAIFAPAKRAMLNDALGAAACVCTVSTEHQRRVAAQYADMMVEYVPNGIALETWKAIPSDYRRGALLRESFGCGERTVIGLFGQLKAKKGLEFFLRTISSLPLHLQPHIVLAGDVDSASLSHFDSLPLTILPFQERYSLIPTYLACDIVAIPSHYDGLPNVLLEAAGLGLPVFAARAGGMKDVLAQFPQLLFPPEDETECRAALVGLMTAGKQELAVIGGKLQQLVSVEYSTEIETGRYKNILGLSKHVLRRRSEVSSDTAPSESTAILN